MGFLNIVWIMFLMYTVWVPCLTTSYAVSAESTTTQMNGGTISTLMTESGTSTRPTNSNTTENVTIATNYSTNGNITPIHTPATSSPNNTWDETNTTTTTTLENSTKQTGESKTENSVRTTTGSQIDHKNTTGENKAINGMCTTTKGKDNDKKNYNAAMMVVVLIVVILAACWSVFVWFWHKKKSVQPSKDCIQLENGNFRVSTKRADTNPYSVANGEDNISDAVESCYDNPNNNAEENDKNESDKESVNTNYADADGLQIRTTTYSDPDYDVLDAEESDESGILDDDYTRANFKNENKKDDPYDTTQSCQRMIYRRKNNETNIPEKINHVIAKGKNGEKYEKCKEEKRRSSENCFTDLNVCLTEDGENNVEDICNVMANEENQESCDEKKRTSKENCFKDLNASVTKDGNSDLEETGMTKFRNT